MNICDVQQVNSYLDDVFHVYNTNEIDVYQENSTPIDHIEQERNMAGNKATVDSVLFRLLVERNKNTYVRTC
jgi:hypothetical protein